MHLVEWRKNRPLTWREIFKINLTGQIQRIRLPKILFILFTQSFFFFGLTIFEGFGK